MAVDVLPLLGFAFAASITPGPNNVMLAASGANFGFRRTLGHMVGIWLGFGLLLFLSGLGMASLFQAYPLANEVLRWVGAAYLCFLAYRIATAAPVKKAEVGKPLRLWEAALFQAVNVKAWTMAFGAFAAFADGSSGAFLEATIVTAVFLTVSPVSSSTWTLFGSAIRLWLKTPRNLRFFNFAMAGLLLLSVAWIFVQG